MKTVVRLAVFLSFFSSIAYAQTNPYLPGGNGTISGPLSDQDRQQLIQNILSGQGTGVGDYVPPSPQDQAPLPPPAVTAPAPPPVSDTEFQELRSQQADDIGAIAREKADREVEIKALKDAFNQQILDMQKKLDTMQTEIDNLRYKDHL